MISRTALLALCAVCCLSVWSGCAVVPRLPLDVQRAVNRDEMRVLHTQSIDLYYPKQRAQEARALAERAEGCIEPLRRASIGRGGISSRRLELLFADLPFNNAFVHPPFNGDFFAVIPSHWTIDIVTETGLPPDPTYVACHELTHYIQAQQTLRSWGGIDRALGYVLTPQAGLDGWFWEGLATYYEEALQPGTGRPAWPAWEGMFRAAVAAKHIDGGDLSGFNRRIHWGNQYLYGSHFIRFLIDIYGETRLWKLIERQGQSFFFPFIVNQRFKRIYGKRLSQLIEEFAAAMQQEYPPRARPGGQHYVREVGMNGRYARASDGSEAIISDAMDAPATLTVYAQDGSIRYSARLTDVLPRRDLVAPQSRVVSGLRFSRDARHVYFVAVDPGLVFQETRLMHLDLDRSSLHAVTDNLGGLGGDLSPDGKHYVFVRVSGEGHALASYELATGQVRELHRPPQGVTFSLPTFSPDGSKLAVSVFAGSYAIGVFDARTGERLRTLSPTSGPLYDASFIDDDQLLFLGAHEGRFQAFAYTLSSKQLTRLTDAPYLVMHPRAAAGTVRFFNRDGLGYTLDEVALPAGPSQAAGVTPTISALTFAPKLLADVGPDAGVSHAEGDAGDAPLDFTGVVTSQQPAAPAAASPATPTVAPVGPAASGPVVPGPVAPGPVAPGPVAPGLVTPRPLTPSPVAPMQVPSGTGVVPAQVTPQAPLQPQPLSIVEDRWLTLPPPPALQLQGATDEAYSSFPRLLIPSVRAPLFSAGPGQLGLGAYLGGTDALGRHRWGGSVAVQPASNMWSGSVGYLNAQLSPLLLQVAASQVAFDALRFRKEDRDNDGKRELVTIHDRNVQRDLTVAALLSLRTSLLALALHATNDQQRDAYLPRDDDPNPALRAELHEQFKNRTLGGGTLSFAHYAAEGTPMSGARRGYWTSLSASYYPESLGTLDTDLTDLRGELWLFSPLPFSRRHTLSLGLRGRAMLSDGSLPLLELGGSPLLHLYDQPNPVDDDPPPGLPPKRRFRENVRGFETAHFNTDRIGIVDLSYRYPIIIDRGTATSFSILPSFFLRQIDLELFASGATDSFKRIGDAGHLAVGGAVSIKFVWFAPLSVRYQLAQRFTDGRDLAQLVSLGADLGG